MGNLQSLESKLPEKLEQRLEFLKQLRVASLELRCISVASRNKVLSTLAEKISSQRQQILEFNSQDVEAFKKNSSFSHVLLDRLILTDARINGMIGSLSSVERMPDPLGRTLTEKTLKNGLILRQRSDSFGVILFIFESRPNVITEAFSLGFKSGNALVFKNGKEASYTAKFIYELIDECLRENNILRTSFQGLAQASREEIHWLLQQDRSIDLVIPRGGDQLIESVKANSRIPVIQNDRGLCHLYVDAEADIEMALRILKNGKTQRPSVCNSLETLLVHEKVAKQFLLLAQKELESNKVLWWVCPQSLVLLGGPNESVMATTPSSFDREYLNLELNCRVVRSLEEVLEHIQLHGSKHSESIVTQNENTARKFQDEVDAAVVYWNASTRFTDGVEFGLGGEIGISTQKLHVRGPVGLDALTTARWVVDGQGQIRP